MKSLDSVQSCVNKSIGNQKVQLRCPGNHVGLRVCSVQWAHWYLPLRWATWIHLSSVVPGAQNRWMHFKSKGEPSLIVVVLILIIINRKTARDFFLFQGYLQWSYPNLQVLHERCDRHWVCLAVGAGSTLLSTRNGRNEPPNHLLTCLFIFLNIRLFFNVMS